MGAGEVRGSASLEAWAETEREGELFTEEESETEEEEGEVAGGGGGLGVSVRQSQRKGSIFTQAYDEGLKALLTPQARCLVMTSCYLVITPHRVSRRSSRCRHGT